LASAPAGMRAARIAVGGGAAIWID
jgi:hypothetical protein